MGIATGYAKFGNVGARERQEYTLIGRPVNLAARVQQEAGAWEVVATQEAWENLSAVAEANGLAVEPRQRRPREVEKSMKGYEHDALVAVRKRK